MVLNTLTVTAAITPTIASTYVNHYARRRSLKRKPTIHISYHLGLELVRRFITYSSKHTVEEIQSFTAQWVPVPRWVRSEEVEISETLLSESAELLQRQLGPKGIQLVGGAHWWQWRRPKTQFKAEWIEMRNDYNERKASGVALSRIILYVHGGAYYFGSVDEHRYQMQRHARKLNARLLAPRYRLAPQFPFPCGLQDCIAAYLYLLESHKPEHIILAGDSAGGGLTLGALVTLRDQGIPLPAGAILLSPWTDLTCSFPSMVCDNQMDYIPTSGFVHKPSLAWPPLNYEDFGKLLASSKTTPPEGYMTPEAAKITLDGHLTDLLEQVQLYAPNHLLLHPLVSPIFQPTLGGLPPLLIQTGGGELLRDEQIYLAHKAANPSAFKLSIKHQDRQGVTETIDGLVAKYPPTNVHLQVWDDLCHVGHTLSWTQPAKYMYRSVAQFGAWALARAQHRAIDIIVDDCISEAESSTESEDSKQSKPPTLPPIAPLNVGPANSVGKAGDPLPAFESYMIRQRVDRHGNIYPLPPADQLSAFTLDPDEIGVFKEGPLRNWFVSKEKADKKFRHEAARWRDRRFSVGWEGFHGPEGIEVPPPTALAGRQSDLVEEGSWLRRQARKSLGMTVWASWAGKHDKARVCDVLYSNHAIPNRR
ncbi:alpha/beta-hydrolase [Eremomyces bilateralis CBS 781.70]|uniref:Alpha/beta-hydrolase n=1 Tax=Eremomyces bilateralis CBS 781.70 TaxID=1392243 RepID=A0A6G1G1K1_9PEZI|nr:alpha/beta-hydrolase [Eremomyces bilateralis CBS 781.70]KAF1811987.1 alpha/beta-hydrolase [Eremomyces bilateralis CBS 781.70]